VKTQVGDWVSYYRGGRLVISEVRYRRQRDSYSGEWELLTQDGALDEDSVLEVRRNGPTEGPTSPSPIGKAK